MTGLFSGATVQELWRPWTLLQSLMLQALYLLLVAGPFRPRRTVAPSGARIACFLAGMWLGYLAFGGPLDYLADEVSFAAHMLQHMVETMWMVPLLLLGLPEPVLRRWRPRPALAAACFNACFLIFHLPGPYDRSLADPSLHLLEHALLFATAAGLWWPVLSPGTALSTLRAKLTYLFANAYVMMPVSALMLLATRPWYASGAAFHGLSPLGDQQWGAIIMMLAMFVAYAVAAIGLLVTAAVPTSGTPGS